MGMALGGTWVRQFGSRGGVTRRHLRQGPYGRPEHLRMLFEDLGATYIKLGQILSARSDILAEPYRVELARLQDAVPAESIADVFAVVEVELARPWREVFASIDALPIASASIGQAFRAELTDGRQVVVKLRRTGVTEEILLDLDLLTALAKHLSLVWPGARRLGLVMLVDEFARTLLGEADYEVEAANADRIAANLADVVGVRVPRIHRWASSPRMLTIDLAQGGRIDDPESLDAAGLDGAAVAYRLVAVMLHMVVVDGIFHADPHPGNIFLDEDGTLVLIDFGMVGELTSELRDELMTLLGAMLTGQIDAICGCFTRLGISNRAVDRDELRGDLGGLLQRYTDRPLGDIGLGAMLHDHMEVARRHGLRMPAELAILTKVLLMTEGLAVRLDPEFEILAAFAGWMTAHERQRTSGPRFGRSAHEAAT
jgi:ubiquinone biosynthesis protein